MREFNDILDEATGQQARLLTEAFELGRAAGRREAAADLSHKLGAVLAAASGEPATAFNAPMPAVVSPEGAGVGLEEDDSDDVERRAPPGSVKPRIAQFVATNPGRTTDEIRDNTGAKKNSVRGTLWLLSTEGQIERRDGRWYPVAQKDEAAGANPEERTPTASVAGNADDDDGNFPNFYPGHGRQAVER